MENINEALELLKSNDVVVAPTDTVYGLFGNAKSDIAIKKIYGIKGRPSYNPLIVHVSDINMALEIANMSQDAINIADYFWNITKKPLTLVLKSKTENKISKYVTANLDTIAIRCPAHPIALELISAFGPLAAPSANTSNYISPTNAEMVRRDLGNKVKLILDGGDCTIGIESTILDLTKDPPLILRHGGVSVEDIEEYLKFKINSYSGNLVIAPGMLKKHYAPKLPLRINASSALEGEAFIGFGTIKCDFNLSPTGNIYEMAHNLFKAISILDNPKRFKGIAIMPIPNISIGLGINDRLSRAKWQ